MIFQHLTVERYEVHVQIPLKCRMPVDATAFATPIQARPTRRLRFGGSYRLANFTLTFLEQPSNGTDLIVDWHFDDLFNEGPYNDFNVETLWETSKAQKNLWLPAPGNSMPFRIINGVDMAFHLALEPMQRLSIVTRAPHLLTAFFEARNQRVGTATISAKGEHFTNGPEAYWSNLAVRPMDPLSLADVRKALARSCHYHELYVLIADIRMLESDLRGAITNLATSMETAAYSLERSIVGGNSTIPNFSPTRYFRGATQPTGIKTWQASNGSLSNPVFKALDSLWGTRSEIVHNGYLKRRTTHKPVKRPDRLPNALNSDYYFFRNAISKCLVWMGFPQIQ